LTVDRCSSFDDETDIRNSLDLFLVLFGAKVEGPEIALAYTVVRAAA